MPRPERLRRRNSVLIYGINYAPEPTGVGRYTSELASFLAKQGCETVVVTAIPHYPGWQPHLGYSNRYSSETHDGVRIVRCPLALTARMRGIWRLIAPLTFALTSAPSAIWKILRGRPATVLCIEPTLFCAPIALLCAKMIGARSVLHVQDLEVDAAFAVGHLGGGGWSLCARAYERAVLRAFDTVITISHQMKKKLELKGICPKRIMVLRNWVDVEKIRPLGRPSEYRAELGLSGEQFVVLYAGNIGAKQALNVVLDAAARLAPLSNYRFVIAGDGPEKKHLVSRYGQLPNVTFLPVQPEERLCELLNLADVHVLPQNREAADLVLPSKLGGMLASGKPCIVMADPGTELHDFLEGVTLLVPSGDSVALSSAIVDVAESKDSCKRGCEGRLLELLDSRMLLPAFRAALLPGSTVLEPAVADSID